MRWENKINIIASNGTKNFWMLMLQNGGKKREYYNWQLQARFEERPSNQATFEKCIIG